MSEHPRSELPPSNQASSAVAPTPSDTVASVQPTKIDLSISFSKPFISGDKPSLGVTITRHKCSYGFYPSISNLQNRLEDLGSFIVSNRADDLTQMKKDWSDGCQSIAKSVEEGTKFTPLPLTISVTETEDNPVRSMATALSSALLSKKADPAGGQFRDRVSFDIKNADEPSVSSLRHVLMR